MDDAISREQAIKATWQDTGYTDPFNVMTAIRDRIKQLPTIQSNIGKWIPVTEEPTDRMICYVTLKDTRDENRQNWVAEMIYTPWNGFDLMDGIKAIAWMPKQYPEPFKEVTE